MQIDAYLSKVSLSSFHFMIVMLCFLIAVVNGFGVVALSVSIPQFALEWGVDSHSFAPAQMAVMVGVLIGAFIGGYLSDRLGRRPTILIMTALMLLAFSLTIYSTGITQLALFRFLTGLGAGGAIPSALALSSEYVPSRYKNSLVIFVFAGPPFSGVIAGNLGPYFMDLYGWKGLFYLGTVMTIVIYLLALILLPESIKYLSLQYQRNKTKIDHLIVKISKTGNPSDISIPQRTGNTKGNNFQALFVDKNKICTPFIWCIFFSTQFVMFYVNLWMPSLLVKEGWTISEAARALAMFNLGSFIGGFILGYFSDKYGIRKILVYVFILAICFLITLSFFVHNMYGYYFVSIFAGACVLGANMGMGPFTSFLYPVQIRGTAIGSALGFGRLGAISAALIGGYLVSIHIEAQTYLLLAIIPFILAIFIIRLLNKVLNSN